MGFNSAWYTTRKKLLSSIRKQIHYRIGVSPADLVRYENEFKKSFNGKWLPSSKGELERAMVDADVLLSSDFHAFAQSQRSHLRLLRALPESQSVVLALECFESRSQELVVAFLKGEISENELLSKTRWNERWQFPFASYRPLLLLARARGLPVYGINKSAGSRSSLNRRDDFAASQIVQIKKKHPSSLVFVVFGELHLAPAHLPKSLANRAVLKTVVVHQNSDRLYFQLAQKGLENKVDVLKKTDRVFCLNDSPPWVKWQSFLMLLEQTFDVDLDDDFDEGPDYTDHVVGFAKWAARELSLSKINYSNLAVYSDLTMSRQNLKKLFGSKDSAYYAKLIENEHSFFAPSLGLGYMSRPTINHAATLAGYFLHSFVNQRNRPLNRFPDDLESAIWAEAIGFFVSKLINHKRKAESALDKRIRWLSAQHSSVGLQALKIAIKHRWTMLKPQADTKLRRSKQNMYAYVEASRLLGQRLGDDLYELHRAGSVSTLQMQRWFKAGRGGENLGPLFREVMIARQEKVGASVER